MPRSGQHSHWCGKSAVGLNRVADRAGDFLGCERANAFQVVVRAGSFRPPRVRRGLHSVNDKTRILYEFVSATGHHRRYAITLLRRSHDAEGSPRPMRGRRIYGEAVTETVKTCSNDLNIRG